MASEIQIDEQGNKYRIHPGIGKVYLVSGCQPGDPNCECAKYLRGQSEYGIVKTSIYCSQNTDIKITGIEHPIVAFIKTSLAAAKSYTEAEFQTKEQITIVQCEDCKKYVHIDCAISFPDGSWNCLMVCKRATK